MKEETSERNILIFQRQDHGDLDHGGSSEGSEKWSDSVYTQ